MNRRDESPACVRAAWDAPARVQALTSLRQGGNSGGPYRSLNLAAHVGDNADLVAANRERLRNYLDLPGEPKWLRQEHSSRCVDAAAVTDPVSADGAYTDQPGVVCAVLTADCLPLFLCNREGSKIGVFHVGWRGLAAGIVESALDCFGQSPGVRGWLGPAIGPDAFEIGEEVREILSDVADRHCFKPSHNPGRWMADLYRLVLLRLERSGIKRVGYSGDTCTFTDERRFFSYRRDGDCGRMASLIWIDDVGF